MTITAGRPDWSFARRPFWLFSHVFAATVIVTFVVLGFWQLSRHSERAALNGQIEARAAGPAVELTAVGDAPPSELDYRFVSGTGTYLDGDLVRVANRSQGGVAGQHLVGLFELDDGRLLLVNRGFVPLTATDDEISPAPTGSVTVTGWLRASAERGWIGATDTGEGDIVPRLDVDAVARRIPPGPGDVIDMWLQLAPPTAGQEPTVASFPDPVPLPATDAGPHLGYMAQWFIFATLGVLFYGALLWRTATGRQRQAPTGPVETSPDPDSEAPARTFG